MVPIESVRAAMSSFVADLTTCSGVGSLEAFQIPDLTSGVVCKQITDCAGARLCEYAGRGHELLPNAFQATWHFLSEAVDSGGN